MPASTITFDDKVTFKEVAVPEINKVTSGNMNEIKNAVNNHAALIDGGSGIRFTAWSFDGASQVNGDPGSGNFRVNNADPTLATEMYVSNFNSQGQDIKEVLDDLATGSNIGIQQESNIAKSLLYDVSGAVVDNTTYRTIPITYLTQGGGGAIDDTELQLFALIPVGGGITGTDERENIAFESDLDNVHEGGYITPVQITDVTSNGISAVVYQGTEDDGLYDFAGDSGEGVTIGTLNTWLAGLPASTWVRVQTITTLSRPSTIKRTINVT